MILLLWKVLGYFVWLGSLPFAGVAALLGSKKWRARLGFVPLRSADIWLHASSMGEVRVVANLVEYLLSKQPGLKLHVTTMTDAGQEEALKMFGNRAFVTYFPLDLPPAVNLAVRRIKPRMMVIAETELWPVLVHRLATQSVPLVLVNGRLTDKSAGRYGLAQGLFREVLGHYDRFFFKTEDDAARYAKLGAPQDRGEVTGDMKFDTPMPERSPDLVTSWRHRLGLPDGSFLFVAGSTRDNEEVQLAEVWRRLRDDFPQLHLAIAPRHVRRSESIERMLCDRGYRVNLLAQVGEGDEVTIINEMGLLNELYLAADLAFVGGTLVDIGGHNLLEPVWAGTPVLYGPSLFEVADKAQYIEANGFGACIQSAEELAESIRSVIMGQLSFRIKTAGDLVESPTSRAGDYILKRLKNA